MLLNWAAPSQRKTMVGGGLRRECKGRGGEWFIESRGETLSKGMIWFSERIYGRLEQAVQMFSRARIPVAQSAGANGRNVGNEISSLILVPPLVPVNYSASDFDDVEVAPPRLSSVYRVEICQKYGVAVTLKWCLSGAVQWR